MAGEEREANVVLTATTTDYSRQMAGAATSTDRVTQSVNKLIETVDKLGKSTSRRLEIVSAATTAGIVAATVAAGRFESQLATLQSQAAIAGRNVANVGEPIDRLRRDLPVTTQQVVALATQLQKLGANPANMERLARVFVKLSAATGEDLGSLTSGMIELQRMMGTSGDSTEKFANSLTQLSASMGVSATGVLQFSQALAPVGRTVGMTQQEIMGFSAAFQKSGQDGFLAASAFSKMLADISRATRYGSAELAMYSNLVGKTQEQFKAMAPADQLVAITDAINKQGPDSIKTLERMGLDGIRAMNAIQGLSRSGGLQESLRTATEGFEGDSLNKGSQAAMDGLNDSLQKLRNNLTSVAQEFGETFLPVATAITNAFTRMTGVIRDALGPVNSILGLLTGAGAAGTGIAGMLAGAFPMLASAAAGVMLMRNGLTAGFTSRRQERTAGRYTPGAANARAAGAFMAGGGSRFQRGLFRAGQGMYMVSGARGRDMLNERVPGAGRGIGPRVAMLGAMGWQGAMGALRSTVDPARWSTIQDASRRTQLSRENMRSSWNAVRTGQGAGYGAAMRTAVMSTARFTAALGSATLGLGRMAAVAGGSALRRAGAGLMGAAGGPWGLALMGGLGLAYANKAAGERGENFRSQLDEAGSGAPLAKYTASLGKASSAALSFADTLKKAEREITGGDPKEVTAADIAAATRPGRKLMNPDLANMTEAQATAYIGALAAGGDPEATQVGKLDLIQTFGAQRARQALGGGTNPSDMLATASGLSLWDQQLQGLSITSSSEGEKGAAAFQGFAEQRLAEIEGTYGREASEQYRAVAINQMLNKMPEQTYQQRLASTRSIESMLGTKHGDLSYIASDDFRSGADRREALLQTATSKGASSALRGYANPAGGVDLNATRFNERAYDPIENSIVSARFNTTAGRLAQEDTAIQAALSQEDNANLNLQAATGFAQKLTEMTGSTAGTVSELQRLKAAIDDPSDAMYKLADSAQQAARRLQNYERAYMAPQDQARNMRGDLARSYRMEGPDAEQQVIAAEDAYEGARANLFGQLKQMSRAYREFDISKSQSREDLGISLGRGAEDFALQQERSQADYGRQMARSWEDFTLQRQRSEEDFALQRARSDQDYYRNLRRGDHDYWLSRRRGQFDFDLSRRRSEEDYQHNIEMQARQTAKTISNIYQMVTVQPSWGADNLLLNARDQLDRMTQQQGDLTKLRGMGVSGDVIEMLGLNKFENQQQLARFVADLSQNPALVEEWNRNIKGRLDISEAFVTDQDSDAYKEMERQFNLTAERATADFERMVKRGSEDYNRGLSRMETDYRQMVARGAEDFSKSMTRQNTDYAKMVARQGEDYARMLKRQNEDYAKSVARTVSDWSRQMTRAEESLNRSFEVVTGTFEELSEEVLGRVTGTTKDQMTVLVKALSDSRAEIKRQATGARKDVEDALTPLFASTRTNRSPGGSFASGGGGGGSPNMRFGGGEGGDTISDRYEDLLDNKISSGGQVHPLAGRSYRVSSPFGYRRHPTLGKRMLHTGQDLAAPTGTPIGAAMDGIVTKAGPGGTYGNLVKLLHGNGLQTWYAHMSRFSVKPGDVVSAGDRIGAVGSTGRSTGPHLHFELRRNGRAVDPKEFLGGASVEGGVSASSIASKIAQSKHMQKIEAALGDTPGLAKYEKGEMTMGVIDSWMKWAQQHGDTAMDTSGWFRQGSIFTGPRKIGVGEGGPEALLPLNERGAEFLAATMRKFTMPQGTDRLPLHGRQTVQTQSVTYQQTIDAGNHFDGDITVQAQDPNEMARKLEEKARMKKLVRPGRPS